MYTTMKTADTERLVSQRAKPSKMKGWSSQLTRKNYSYCCAPL